LYWFKIFGTGLKNLYWVKNFVLVQKIWYQGLKLNYNMYIKIFPLSSADHKQVIGRLQCKSALQGAGGWGVLPYMGYIDICCGIGYGV